MSKKLITPSDKMLCCYVQYIPSVLFIVTVSLLIWLRFRYGRKRIAVVVLGDIGRSPRMQYHAISFSKVGFLVDIIGYGGSIPHKNVISNENINVYKMAETPRCIDKMPRILAYGAKTCWQSVVLTVTLLVVCRPSHILMQNPPSIPAMAVCWIISLMRGCKFIIDWHNYGHTILALALGKKHKLVKVADWFEHYFGKKASGNICVTNGMKEDLSRNWNITAQTHYDRPPEIFHTIDLTTQHELFVKLSEAHKVFQSREATNSNPNIEITAFTRKSIDGVVQLIPSRPALLVSSTSWTEDEDFSILYNALEKYQDAYSHPPLMTSLPKLVCVVTGRGPMKEKFLAQIAASDWQHVEVCTPWLEAEDYPKLLASADLGVCLHTSSSGLDLPMKVVDMFGSSLPVCAICFKCLPELVVHEENGLVFHCAHELAQQIQELLQGFPDRSHKLETFRKNLQEFQNTRWHQTWEENVLPLFE